MKKALSPVAASIVLLACAPLFGAGLYTHGHGDVRVYYEGGELKLRYQVDGNSIVDGSPVDPVTQSIPASYGLGDLVTSIPDVTISLPGGLSGYEFLGAGPGEPLWYVPEVQEEDRPWLGFSSEELSYEDWAGPPHLDQGVLQLELVDVVGPAGGYFSLIQTDSFGGPLVQMYTLDGIDGSDVYKYLAPGGSEPGFLAGVHAHASWIFTEPGVYDVTLKFSGTHLSDGYKEVTGTVRFAVAIPEPCGAVLMVIGLVATCSWRRCSSRRLISGGRSPDMAP